MSLVGTCQVVTGSKLHRSTLGQGRYAGAPQGYLRWGTPGKKKLAVLLVLGTIFALYQVNEIIEQLSYASNIALQVFASKYSKLVDTINV